MHALQLLLINSVWVVGLAGLLATVSYLDWYRTVRRWTFQEIFQRPVALVPLSISLTCFCTGLLISELFSVSISFVPTNIALLGTLWRPIVWAVFTLLFASQSFQKIMYGRRHGWDSPIAS